MFAYGTYPVAMPPRKVDVDWLAAFGCGAGGCGLAGLEAMEPPGYMNPVPAAAAAAAA